MTHRLEPSPPTNRDDARAAESPPRWPFFFTWSAQRDAKPLELTGGEGAHFTTRDGGRWLDLGSLIYQVNAGHGHARIVEAVREQASRLCVSIPGAVYPEKIALAEKLLALAPPAFARGKVFFTLGGSDANENAIKIAKLATRRHKLIARYESYHGATMGAVTLSGDWRRTAVEPGLVGVVHVPDWDWVRARSDRDPPSLVPRVMELEDPSTIAAVFVEPVVGANGVLIPPAGYFRALREACDRAGALLVVDEVLTGFGRTGRWFAYEHFDGVVPDMITMGKAITGGYGTLGAVVVAEHVATRFDDQVLAAGLTSYAHPLAVAAACAAIDVYRDEALVERAEALGAVLGEELADIVRRADAASCSRSLGLLGAMELSLDAGQWARLKASLSARRIHAHVLPKTRAVVVAPPLVIREDELRGGLRALGEVIDEVSR